ncbi:hypothetical protein niasHS_015895 [Heterodera schachtii]|uniref:Uncharacterized protein n=1 Tax=Heterodera schachtii TaxID=97005 RepID=A0ABD2HT37_HETSC
MGKMIVVKRKLIDWTTKKSLGTKKQHSSMPPLERLRLMQAQQQMPHELVLDRFPPQLVQSVHQLADAAERRHERSSNSRGFSPFPVFSPFITGSTSGGSGATMAPQPRQKSVPPQATYDGTKRWAMAPPREEIYPFLTNCQNNNKTIHQFAASTNDIRLYVEKSRLMPYAKRKTVHELLKRISGEIETIHDF